MPKALSLCALVGSKNVLLKPGAQQHDCQGTCGRKVWVSPSTLAMGTENVTLMCNDCGRAAIMAQAIVHPEVPMALRYNGLNDGTPDDERRKRELEARGFKAASPQEIAEIRRGD